MSPIRQKVEGVLRDISTSLGMDLRLNYNGLVVLNCEGGGTCTIEAPHKIEGVFIYASVCDITHNAEGTEYRGSEFKMQIFSRAMEMNLFKAQPLGSWLACDQNRGLILLCYRVLEEELEAEAFSNLLLGIIESAQALKEHLLAPATHGSSVPTDVVPLFEEFLGSAFV